eukprot:7264787-Alexandrium_andersonii.AAC.1
MCIRDRTGPDQATDDLLSYMGTEMLLKVGLKEHPGQVGETLGRMKMFTDNGNIMIPDAHHFNNAFRLLGMDQRPPQRTCGVPGLLLTKVSEEEKQRLDGEQATLYRQGVGSRIYATENCMDIKNAVKQLAKKLSKPGACDLARLRRLARYCWHTCDWVRSNAGKENDSKDFTFDVHHDSDRAEDPEDYKSTIETAIKPRGFLLYSSSKAQPGLPSLSSREAA